MKGESEGGRKKIRERRVKNERNREGVTDRQINRLTDKQTNKQRNSKQDRDRARDWVKINHFNPMRKSIYNN